MVRLERVEKTRFDPLAEEMQTREILYSGRRMAVEF